MGPEWHLPPSPPLLCSAPGAPCLACPCHKKMHHVTAPSAGTRTAQGCPGCGPCHFGCPRFPSFPCWLLTSPLGSAWQPAWELWVPQGGPMELGASPHRAWQAPAAPPCCTGVWCLFFPISFLAAVEVWDSPTRAAVIQEGSPPAPLSALRAPQTRGAGSPPAPRSALHLPQCQWDTCQILMAA